MSNSMPRPAVSAHPTQQQLDELDALMQRMLALPVNQLGDDLDAAVASTPAMPSTPEWEGAVDAPSLLAETTGIEEEQEPRDLDDTPDEPLPAISRLDRAVPWPTKEARETFAPENPRSEAQELKNEPPATFPMSDRTVPVLRAPIVVRPAESESNGTAAGTNGIKKARAALGDRPRRPFRDRPGLGRRSLLWSNRTFDRYIGRLGSTGRWLRGRYGRAVLGLTGLLLLAAALVLGTLDWIGWTW